MKRILARLSVVYLVLLAVFFSLIVLVHLIPRQYIEYNVGISAEILEEESIYERKWGKGQIFKLDNMTDAIMLNIAVSADDTHPVEAAMNNYYYLGTEWSKKAQDLEKAVKGETADLQRLSYGRYWQGYQIFLRPTLCFMSHYGIRKINNLLLWPLAVLCLIMIWKKVGWVESVLFLVALLRVVFPVVPFSMQYTTCFYLMFVYILAIMWFPRLWRDRDSRITTFFIFGAITVYLDFQTTPQLTLGLPLIFLMLMSPQTERSYRAVIEPTLSWGLGYSLLWVSKWIVGYLLTGYNIVADAVEMAKFRMSNNLGDQDLTWSYIWNEKISMPEPIVWIAVTAMFIGMYLWLHKTPAGKQILKDNAWLLLIALIVPVWFMIMRNHTIIHLFFTRRALMLPLYAVMIWVYKSVKSKQSVQDAAV